MRNQLHLLTSFSWRSRTTREAKMQFYTAIIVIALSAVASMAEFICSPKAAPNAVTANFGGCCQTIDEHNGGQNCENINLNTPHSPRDLTKLFYRHESHVKLNGHSHKCEWHFGIHTTIPMLRYRQTRKHLLSSNQFIQGMLWSDLFSALQGIESSDR